MPTFVKDTSLDIYYNPDFTKEISNAIDKEILNDILYQLRFRDGRYVIAGVDFGTGSDRTTEIEYDVRSNVWLEPPKEIERKDKWLIQAFTSFQKMHYIDIK